MKKNKKSESMKKETENSEKEVEETETVENQQEPETQTETEEEVDEMAEMQKKVDGLSADLEKSKSDYLFLMAEFDNYRKRTLKEKAELIQNGGERAMKDILPVIDDFERGMQAIETSSDVEAVKEGMVLIYNKFEKYLEQNGVSTIPSEAGCDFDTEVHEAVTAFPTDDEKMKGKIIDTVQKGYKLQDKLLRHSKVVVGQ